MPRGFLKRANGSGAVISKKASRGGGSGPGVRYKTGFYWDEREYNRTRCLRPLNSIAEDGIGEYYSDYDCDSDEGEGIAMDLDDDSMISDDADVSVSEDDSISDETTLEYSFCDDGANSSFSIIENPSIVSGSNSNDEDESFFAINTCDLESLASVETSEKAPATSEKAPALERAEDNKRAELCAICLEEKPLLQLMKKCSCHPSACKECLRATYISHSLDDPNMHLNCAYPLRCFWPGCERPLRDVQVKKIAQSREDIEKYYSFVARKKIQRREEGKHLGARADRARHLNKFRTIQNCPSCRHPNTVRPYRNISDADTKVCCLKCSHVFEVQKLPRKEILSILDALGDEIAACPSCGAFFAKDGGCDHMTCLCGEEFSFLQQISAGAKIRLRREYGHV